MPLQSDALLHNPPATITPRVELTTVPFNPQTRFQCGPAALATMLQAINIAVTAEALEPEVYLPAEKGSLQTELIAAARRYNQAPYTLPRSMLALLRELDAGNPVLVLQNLGLSFAPRWHYAVVVGYDLDQEQLILRSGTYRRHINDFTLFERTWRRAKYWGLVIPGDNRLPVTATPLAVLKTALPFEQTGKPQQAYALYRSALQRWPQNVTLLVASGNITFTMNRLDQAEQYYRAALAVNPAYAPALHNLAEVLIKHGEYTEASTLLKKAISLGGRHQSQYRQSLRELESLQAR